MPPLDNAVAAMADQLAATRRDIHRHPELGYEETRTAALVAERLRALGFDAVETGVGRTGVVGVLHGAGGAGDEARTVLLRADMDALPIAEATGAEHASTVPGKMHACGHDGHTTMLLGAAERLAASRNFDGSVVFCFQPAEEGGAGAKAMLDDGLLERFPARAVYGMHNMPGLPVGAFAIAAGPVTAIADEIAIRIRGRGSHAAEPHNSRDPIAAGVAIHQALQTVVSRRTDPMQPVVLSITRFNAGFAHNVIPDEAELAGTVRAYSDATHQHMLAEIRRAAEGVGAAFGVSVEVKSAPMFYPATVNDEAEVERIGGVLDALVGPEHVVRGHPPAMWGEDFAFLARERPGAMILIGNGESAPLHDPAYDFSDDAAPFGVAYWTRLVETALPRHG